MGLGFLPESAPDTAIYIDPEDKGDPVLLMEKVYR